MTLNGGKLGDARILSPKSVELMTVDHLGGLLMRNVNDTGALFGEESGVGFGLGFRIVDDLGARGALGSAGEYGWGGAYHSSYWVDPQEELVVVYLAQLIPAGNLDDHAQVPGADLPGDRHEQLSGAVAGMARHRASDRNEPTAGPVDRALSARDLWDKVVQTAVVSGIDSAVLPLRTSSTCCCR